MRQVETYGHIDQGILKIHKREQFNSAIKQLTDGRVRVKVEKVYRKRTNPMNAYYWGVVLYEFCQGFADVSGENIDSNTAHEFLKQRFNSMELISRDGEVINVGKTTSELTTTEFGEYIENCRRFISEFFNREVLSPNEQAELEF